MFGATKRHPKPFVGEISIGQPKGASSSLASLKTASGVGLGSAAAAVKRAYPKVTGSPRSDYLLQGHGEVHTVFSFTDGVVTQITVQGIALG